MRMIDETKRKKIQDAVYELTQTNGLSELSMSKVAKLAGVSPATIYIYYKDKEDMLSRMYEQVKDLMDTGLQAEIDSADSIDDQIRTAEWHFIKKFQAFPSQAAFLSMILNEPTQIDQRAQEYGEQQALPLTKVFLAAKQNDEYVDVDEKVAAVVFAIPQILLNTNPSATSQQLEQAIEMVVKAFKK